MPVDHLGTVRATVNQDGIVVETRDYAPFGESIAHVGAFSVQHRFTAQPQDEQAGGLYNYGARFYNAKWGRFASPDKVVQSFDSQGLNPFTYVLNRPTSGTDPTGTFGIPGDFGTVLGSGLGLGAVAQAGAAIALGSQQVGLHSGERVADCFPNCSEPGEGFWWYSGVEVSEPLVAFAAGDSWVVEAQVYWPGGGTGCRDPWKCIAGGGGRGSVPVYRPTPPPQPRAPVASRGAGTAPKVEARVGQVPARLSLRARRKRFGRAVRVLWKIYDENARARSVTH
jgi:RHS repeat-associated protein